jgi:hypothetical protein
LAQVDYQFIVVFLAIELTQTTVAVAELRLGLCVRSLAAKSAHKLGENVTCEQLLRGMLLLLRKRGSSATATPVDWTCDKQQRALPQRRADLAGNLPFQQQIFL